jgi:tripartite-type tricarboxylate transporter receptor subunit TctC
VRLGALPEVPTLAELGWAVDVRDWHGIVAPASLPQPVLARLVAALDAVLALPEVQQRFAAVGLEPATSDPTQFRAHIGAEIERWGRLVQAAGIRAD